MYRLTITFFIFLFQFSNAQKITIKGKVFSEEGNLPFASIQIKSSSKGTTSNAAGEYEFEIDHTDEVVLHASFLGYITTERKIQIKNQKEIILNFFLLAQNNLDEVVITGTTKESFVSASPIKIDVVTSKKLETYLPSASASVIDAIKLVNGVQEVIDCGVCYTNNISINGLEGAYTAILMDGTPMYGNLASVYGLNGIPSMIIDRFEVIKGPNSTLYGSEAVAGVINIITKNPKNEPVLAADIMTTSRKEVFANLAYAPNIGETSGFIGLNYAYQNDYDDINNDGFGDGINIDRIALFSKFNIARKSQKTFNISAKYYYEDRRNGVKEFLQNRNYKKLRGSDLIYGESIYTKRFEFFGTYHFNFPEDLKIDFSLSDHKQNSFYGDTFYKAEQRIAFGNLIWNKELKKHDIVTGITARYNAYDDNTIATQKIGDGKTENNPNNQFIPGIFVQDEYSLSDNMTLLGGVRMDYYNEHGTIFSPRLNVKFKSGQWTTFRANFGTGFRIVNLFAEDHAFVTGQREVVINEVLEPEESYNFSLNFNHVYTSLGGSGNFDLDAYYTYFFNKIIPDYGESGKIIYENSEGFAETMGISLNVNHNFNFPLFLYIGLNFQNAQKTESDRLGNEFTEDLLFAPNWSGVITANYIYRKSKITLAYTANFTGEMALPKVYDVDSKGIQLKEPRSQKSDYFSIHNLMITKDMENIKIYLGLDNFLNFVQKDSPLAGYNDPNYAPGFSPFFDTSYTYAPNHGIELFLGFKYNLK